MLYSKHQAISTGDDIFSKMFAGTYNGKLFDKSGSLISDLSDEQKDFLKNDEVRHVLIKAIYNAEVGVTWNNNLQEFAEGFGLGIPVNISTDHRHNPIANTEFNSGAGSDISKWSFAISNA